MIYFNFGNFISVCLFLLLGVLILEFGFHGSTVGVNDSIIFSEPISGSEKIPDTSIPGTLQIPYSGLMTRSINPTLAERLGLDATTRGALIAGIIPGSPAEKLGLQPMNLSRQGSADEILAARGDIIQAVEGSTSFLTGYPTIEQYFSENKKVGENITLSILRNGEVQYMEMTLTSKPAFLWYENAKEGVRIKYPADWTVAEEEEPSTASVVLFHSPETASLNNLPVAYFSIAKYSSKFSDSPEALDTDVGKDTDIYRILDFNTTRLDNSSAYFSIFYNYSQKNSVWKTLTVFAESDSKINALTFSTNPDKYSDYLPLIREMVESFQFKG